MGQEMRDLGDTQQSGDRNQCPEKLNRYFDKCKERIDQIFSDPERYGYVPNFLDRTRGANWENFTPAHQAVLLDMFATTYAKNYDEIQERLKENPQFDVISFIAEKVISLDVDGPGYRDKLISRDGFILEMPGDCAQVKPTELRHRDEIFEAMGLDASKVSLRNQEGHCTYGRQLFRIGDNPALLGIGDLFAGGLQGAHRKNASKTQRQLRIEQLTDLIAKEQSKEPIDEKRLQSYETERKELQDEQAAYKQAGMPEKDAISFNAGSQVFLPTERGTRNEALGPRVLEFVDNVHESNQNLNSSQFKGYTAGVSGNAMHYALLANDFSRQVLGQELSPEDSDVLYDVVAAHIVGVNADPLHHSLPETRLGFDIGVALSNQPGEIAEDTLVSIIDGAVKETAQYINGVLQKTSPTETPVPVPNTTQKFRDSLQEIKGADPQSAKSDIVDETPTEDFSPKLTG